MNKYEQQRPKEPKKKRGIKDVPKSFHSRMPQMNMRNKKAPKKPKVIEQVPQSMMKGTDRDSIFSNEKKYYFESWVEMLKKQKKGLFKKKSKFYRYFLKYYKDNELHFFENFNDGNPIVKYKLLDCTFKKTDRKLFLVDVFANDYKKDSVKVQLTIKCSDNLQYGDFIRMLQFFKIEDVTPKEKKEFKGRISSPIVTGGVNVFFSKPVKNWENQDVLDWAQDIIVGEDFEESLFDIGGEIIKNKSMNGKFLLKLTKEEIGDLTDEFGITVYRAKSHLRKQILLLQERGYFDPVQNVVTKKVCRMLERQGQKKIPIIIQKFTKAFGDRDFIQANMKRILYRDEVDDINKSHIFRVKLIIVENMRDDRMKRLRKVFGKILKVKDAFKIEDDNTKYGLFHASISIGPLQLEWVDTSITIVRPVCSEKVLLCVDLANVEVENGEEFTKNLAKECLRWNREFEYEAFHASLRKSVKYCNCQQFVIQLLDFLKIEYNFTPHIDNFINKRLKYQGKCRMIFDFDKKFAKKFKLTKKFKKFEYEPKTHLELDNFVNGLFTICPNFETEYSSEFSLLKGFDRAFWMKHMKTQMNPPAKRVQSSKKKFTGCPFCDDPTTAFKDIKSIIEKDDEEEIEDIVNEESDDFSSDDEDSDD